MNPTPPGPQCSGRVGGLVGRRCKRLAASGCVVYDGIGRERPVCKQHLKVAERRASILLWPKEVA